MKQIYLGEAMRQRREELNLSQEIVCEGICDVASLSRLENGRHTPSHNRIKALMQRLNMPDDRYYALLNKQEMALDNAHRELLSYMYRFGRAEGVHKQRLWTLAMEQLHRLETLVEKDDNITQQFILGSKALLGRLDGPYSLEERLEMQFAALRLTVPRFDLEKLDRQRYSVDETRLISQIAGTYSKNRESDKALKIYRQLFEYVKKSDDQLSNFAPHFTMIAYGYSRELGLQKNYNKSIDIAEQGQNISIDYGYYQFLPGLLAIMGECYYQLGEEMISKKLCMQAHYLYEVLGDKHNLSIIDPDIKKRFHIEFTD